MHIVHLMYTYERHSILGFGVAIPRNLYQPLR